MVSFISPYWLLGLLISPLIVLVFRKAQQQVLIAPHLQQGATATRRYAGIVPAIAWSLAVIALSGPNWRQQEVPLLRIDQARVFVLDMSLSMTGTDLKPSRNQQAIYKMTDLIKGLDGGYTALVAYTNAGYVVSPMTHDTVSILNHLPQLSPTLMPTFGKDAATGIESAIELLQQSQFNHGQIVLVTSGVSEKEAAKIDQIIRQTPYSLSTYAMSTTEGSTLTRPDGSMLTDQNGHPVFSRLVPSRLSQLAASHDGIFTAYQASNADIDSLLPMLNETLTTESIESDDNKTSSMVINDGYWLLWPIALLALFAFRRGVIVSLVLVTTLTIGEPLHASEELELPAPTINPLQGQLWENNEVKAYRQYQEQDFTSAAAHFEDPAWKGAAAYEAGDYQGAIDAYSTIKDGSADYNLANALAQNQQFEEAIEKYREFLERHPDHANAKQNLATVEALKEEQEKQNSEQQGQEGDESQSGDQQDGQNQQSDQGQSSEQQDQQSQDQSQSQQDQSQQGQSQQSQSSQDEATQREEQQAEQDESQDGEAQDEQTEQDAETSSDQQSAEETDEQTEQQNEAMSQSGDVEETDPVLNKLNQLPDHRDLLLRNQLRLQAIKQRTPNQQNIEW
uniref:VWA domain-containing protein n=1 Tax=Thaumasiovibrio occultus TaxID=1891184 RepID=UPI000B3594D4|nr:VWA domain-containing protein [Thaumasiovibrio occultus]